MAGKVYTISKRIFHYRRSGTQASADVVVTLVCESNRGSDT